MADGGPQPAAKAAKSGTHARARPEPSKPEAFFSTQVHRKACACPECQARRLQRKPLVAAETDPQEAEAERLAEAVVAGPLPEGAAGPPDDAPDEGASGGEGGGAGSVDDNPPDAPPTEPVVQRAARDPAHEEEAPGGDAPDVQPMLDPDAAPATANDDESLRARLDARAGAGMPLPAPIRTYLEARLGRDLSRVRLHLDAEAAELARRFGALAFAYGQDIYFGDGAFDPRSLVGLRLIAHEVVHTIQQASPGRSPTIQRDVPTGQTADTGPDNIASPPQARISVRLSGITVRPINGTWGAGDRLPQATAILLRRLVGNSYRPEMVTRFLSSSYVTNPSVSGNLAQTGVRQMTTFTISGVLPNNFVLFCQGGAGSRTSVDLTPQQMRLITLGADAHQAWNTIRTMQNGGRLQPFPGWFNRNLFFNMVGSRVTMLEQFAAAHRTGDTAGAEAAASDLLASILEQSAVIEAIRLDQRLISEVGYRLLWPMPRPAGASESDPPPPRTTIAGPGRSEIDGAILRILLPYLRTQPALVRAALGTNDTEALAARRTLLSRFFRIAGDIVPGGDGDQQLSDHPARLATHPGHPATLSVHPQLAPPFYDAATGTSHHFTMAVRFPTVLDAFQGYTYRFALFKMDPAQVIGAAQAGSGPAPDAPAGDGAAPAPPVQRPAAESDVPVQSPSPAPEGAPDVPVQRPSAELDAPAVPVQRPSSPGIDATPDGATRTQGGSILGTRLARDARYLRADVETVINDWKEDFGSPGTSLGLVAVGGLLRFAGTVVSRILERMFEPAYTHQFVMEDEGLYLVRAIAYPHNSDEAEVTRTPSIAYMPIFARDPEVMAEARARAQESQRNRDAERLHEAAVELRAAAPGSADAIRLAEEIRALDMAQSDIQTQLADQYHRLTEQIDALTLEVLNGTDPNSTQGQTLLRIHPLADQLTSLIARREQIRLMWVKRRDRGLSASAERVIASFVSDRGQTINLLVEAQNVTPAGRTGSVSWYVSDVTTPRSGDTTGTGNNKAEAITSALQRILQSGAGYGRGELSVIIDGTPVPVRIEANSDELMMEALENLATIASVAAIAAAPFTGGSSLSLLIPIGLIGAIPSAYRIAQRVDNEAFQWDMETAMDVVNIVSSVVAAGQVGAGARATALASRGAGGAALRAYALSGSLMITGFGLDGLGVALMGAGIVQQLNATSDLPDGLRQARIAEILGGAMLNAGIMVGGALASSRTQNQIERGVQDSQTPFSRWFEGLEEATQNRLREEPRLMEMYSAMDATVRRVLTRCGSWCIPIDAPPDPAQVQRLQDMVNRLQPTEDHIRYLQAYFHDRRAALGAAIGAVESLPTLADLQTFLTAPQANGLPRVSASDAVLLGYSPASRVTRGPATRAAIDRIIGNGHLGVGRLGKLLDVMAARRMYGQQVQRVLGYVETLVTNQPPGFNHVLRDLEAGYHKFTGAEFVLRYISDNNLWSNIARFETSAGGGVRFWDATMLGINFEFKNWGAFTPHLERSMLEQLIKDYTHAGTPMSDNMRWVFSQRIGLTSTQIEAHMVSLINAEAASANPRFGYTPTIAAGLIAQIQTGQIVIVH